MTILVTDLVAESAVALNRVVVLPRVGTALESAFLAVRIHRLLVGQLQSGQMNVDIGESATYDAVAMVSVGNLGRHVVVARELVELARRVGVAAGRRVIWPLGRRCLTLQKIRILHLEVVLLGLSHHGPGASATTSTQATRGPIGMFKLRPLVRGHETCSRESRDESEELHIDNIESCQVSLRN